MFESVLIANRGEIAVRVATTLRKMGIRSVVVASIPDRKSLAVRTADDWVLLEGYSAAESYLDVDAVIAAAKEKGCQAIHPGYGFLAERADFAEQCAAAGITFIGPPPEVLRGLGDKSAARKLAVENGVPVVPGWDGEDDAETLIREAARIGYPVMLKARGGGGGRGMREVFEPAELPEAIESARREALAAFGDGGLLIEKRVTEAHHVEVQVLADGHGDVIHLGERDCSVQRRHQKLIEESPSPVVDDALRADLTGAALKLARAVNYVNAGTFEFLVGAPGADRRRLFYFLEVNPRLQVEHPVTEMVTGLDIVELQVRIAAGEPLPLRQEDVKFEGHAIEFRINAEDPWDGFRPSSGRIVEVGPERQLIARWDSGYQPLDTIPGQYDSLLGKLIVYGPSRDEALSETLDLSHYFNVIGVPTNALFVQGIARTDRFVAGTATTGWLEGALAHLLEEARPPGVLLALAAASLYEHRGVSGIRPNHSGPTNPVLYLSYGGPPERVEAVRTGWLVRGTIHALEIKRWHADHFSTASRLGDLHSFVASPGDVSVWEGEEGSKTWVFQCTLVPPPPLPRRAHTAAEGATAITAPLAGTIAAVRVAEGETVEASQPLVMLEAMKMEHRIVAPAEGTVRTVLVKQGDVVREGDILVELA